MMCTNTYLRYTCGKRFTHTSLLVVYSLWVRDSTAIHFTGTGPWNQKIGLIYIKYKYYYNTLISIYLAFPYQSMIAKPKSTAIFKHYKSQKLTITPSLLNGLHSCNNVRKFHPGLEYTSCINQAFSYRTQHSHLFSCGILDSGTNPWPIQNHRFWRCYPRPTGRF